LHFLDRHFGGTSSLKAISALCPPLRDGTPLADVAKAAQQLGYGVTPFSTRGWNLSRIEGPAILHMLGPSRQNVEDSWTDKHFVVLLGYDPSQDQFLIYDPPNEVRYVERRYLTSRFSGVGLLVGPDKDHPPALEGALAGRSLWQPAGFLLGLASVWWAPRLWRRTAGKRQATIAAGLALLLLPGCQRQAADAAPAADAYMARRYLAGDVPAGRKISHTFHLENQSGRPFKITGISSSCTCTHSFVDGQPGELAAGASTPLKAEFDTKGQRGKQRKSIIVATDSPDSQWQRIEFELVADVFQPVQSVPESVYFGALGRGQRATKHLTLEANDPVWQGLVPEVLGAGARLQVRPLDSPSPRLKKYALEFDPPPANGPVRSELTFRFQKNGETLDVPVTLLAEVSGPLQATPRRIVLTSVDLSLARRQRLRIASSGGQAFSVVGFELPSGVSVSHQPTAAAAVHNLELTIDGSQLPTETRPIAVLTDMPDDGRVEIPVVIGKGAVKGKS